MYYKGISNVGLSGFKSDRFERNSIHKGTVQQCFWYKQEWTSCVSSNTQIGIETVFYHKIEDILKGFLFVHHLLGGAGSKDRCVITFEGE